MGQGPTIQELAEREAKFRDYLKQIRSEAEADKAKDIDAVVGEAKKFYEKGGWDYKPLVQADLLDVQQLSSWSLDNVAKILEGVQKSLFGSSPQPSGVEIEKPDDFAKALGALGNLNVLVLARAFQLIQGVLETFATESSYKGKSILKSEVLAPGTTLFLSIRSDVWQNKGFFNNDYIGQYLVVARAYFSLQQAGDISKYNDLLAYEDLKTSYRARMRALADKIADPDLSFEAVVQLEAQVGYYAKQLTQIQVKIDELLEKESSSILSFARQARERRAVERHIE
jgi:hypothetical protein